MTDHERLRDLVIAYWRSPSTPAGAAVEHRLMNAVDELAHQLGVSNPVDSVPWNERGIPQEWSTQQAQAVLERLVPPAPSPPPEPVPSDADLDALHYRVASALANLRRALR